MARPFPTSSLQPRGDVDFEELSAGKYKVLFTPSEDTISISGRERKELKRRIAVVDTGNKVCTIFPYTVHGVVPMSAKYYGIDAISIDIIYNAELDIHDEYGFDDFLNRILPNAFSEDFNYGLGFKKNYKPIITLLESFGITRMNIVSTGKTRIDKETKQATVKRTDLDKMCRAIDRITNKAQKVSMSFRKNVVSELFVELITNAGNLHQSKKESEELAKQIGLTSRFMTGGATKKEQNDAMEVIRKNGRKIMSEHPEELIKLKNDIELVSLQTLIGRFENMLEKDLPETNWQKLFSENPFILNLALGIPVIKVQEQASMGGMKLSGVGTKIADFLVKNRLSNNAGIVEIKTPALKLLNSKTYRSGIYPPSNDLNAAVSQILDQVHLFQKDINNLKVASRQFDIESYAVHGVLIAGISPKKADEIKSFELFRGNSKNVQVITFDELLQKLKDLNEFLQPAEAPIIGSTNQANNITDDNLPF